MPSTLIIREARSAEYDEVAAVTMAAYRPLFAETGLPDDLGWYGAELRDVAGRAERAEIIVAELDKRIVGSLAYDDLETEVGNVTNSLGGSGTFAGIAAAFHASRRLDPGGTLPVGLVCAGCTTASWSRTPSCVGACSKR